MNIALASIEDIGALCLLINSAYRGESSRQGWTTEADLIDGTRTDEAALRYYISDQNAIILKATNESQEIIGCVYLKKEPDHLYLGMLTVSPAFQAKGVGKLLLRAAEKQAGLWRSEKIVMTVISARAELLNWYARHGYVQTGKKQPFHSEEKFGKPRRFLELLVLEKNV